MEEGFGIRDAEEHRCLHHALTPVPAQARWFGRLECEGGTGRHC